MIDDDVPPEEESKRERDRRFRRELGKRSADLARVLMLLDVSRLARIELDEDTRDAIERAQSVKSRPARRRAERELAGYLRTVEIGAVEAQIEKYERSERANSRLFKKAESWRTALLDEGESAVRALNDEFPGLEPDHWNTLIADAQRQRTMGKPKGAGKALFRALMHALEASEAEE